MRRLSAVGLALLGLLWFVTQPSPAQIQTSGGGAVVLQPGSNLAGKFGIDQTTPGTTNKVSIGTDGVVAIGAGSSVIGHVINDASSAVIGHVVVDSAASTSVSSLPALAAGTNNIGLVRVLPSSCTQSTPFAAATAQVATGAGTTVTSTTTCVTFAYANNITNAAVTLRLADKAGTPVIWLGGNADFTIPANSNIRIPLDGVTFTSGITAIAGTASAINLQINGVQ